ncbi:bifunctional 2-polyprenyl-6-hydroxyphenol methylase/3-demethylubiquinol 3-O-methyltransferase UbiG [Paenibacillus thiaminolyticus]|uniref:Class I SAM-dependent methyltransferase n=1 Tax=Paenibacillus thiaminolyticus TaxID=49283 RepID=A0A3A3H3U8_PANTH|nr:class I SAM-dependent methyltransferase [Paenibacillus thiaminolyticus]RJG26172.1 class I SAM-dependent methyltransferase [Paenibacillus thiaminolyticus]
MTQYDTIAPNYESFIPEPEYFFDYYTRFAKPGSRILDIGCGTGRLAMKLAERGAVVTAVDISPGMIEVAQQKLALRPELAARLHYEVSDATSYRSEQQFDLILMTGGVFEYLLTPSQQKRTLCAIREMLKSGGHFVFDIISPPQICPYAKRQKDGAYSLGSGGNSAQTLKSWNKVRIDHFRQVVETTCFFELYNDKEERIKQFDYKFISRYSLPAEMIHLLDCCGLAIDRFFGNYDRSPFQRGSEFMIFETSLKEDTHDCSTDA